MEISDTPYPDPAPVGLPACIRWSISLPIKVIDPARSFLSGNADYREGRNDGWQEGWNHCVDEARKALDNAKVFIEKDGQQRPLAEFLYLLTGERDRFKQLAEHGAEVEQRLQRALDEERLSSRLACAGPATVSLEARAPSTAGLYMKAAGATKEFESQKPLPPDERSAEDARIIAQNQAVWRLIYVAERCGAKKDEDDNNTWWTLDVPAFYTLADKLGFHYTPPKDLAEPIVTRMYVDCEYNSYKGELISMALVTDAGQEWYYSLGCENPDPWVAEHVMPVLYTDPISREHFQANLREWLLQFEAIHVVADWPEDIAHFCQSLITGPGDRIDTPPLTMEVVRIDAPSDTPHNALEDARGIRKFMKTTRPSRA